MSGGGGGGGSPYRASSSVCDSDAPVRPPPSARRRRQRPSGRTTAATAATPGLVSASVGPHRRPNLLREHLFVLHMLTEACFAGPREEVGFAAAGDGLARPSPTTTVTAANAAPAVAAVTRRHWLRKKIRWRLQELLAGVLSAVGWRRSGSRWRKTFTVQVLSRKRPSRKSTRAVEESLLVVLALDTFGLLRGE
jgi:hypothetical protein